MIAKFHSAPGHSMETTLTINLPPPQSVRAARGERLKEKREDKGKKKEKEEVKEREREKEREIERERQKELKEQEKDRTPKTHSGGNVSYKDKFQKMREKYDKVTLTHEANQRDLEILNAKIKKLQAENDLLLDAMYLAEPALYERYFPAEPDSASSFLGPSPSDLPHPPQNDRQLSHHSRISDLVPTLPSDLYPPSYPPSTYANGDYYPATMPRPAPGLSATSATSGPPGSAGLTSMPPPPSPSTSMPPPSSASSNGTITGDRYRARGHSSRPPSSPSSSRSRRRSDAHGGHDFIPLAPEDPNANGTRGSIERTPLRRTPTPTRHGGMDLDDVPLRSPRVNGNSAASTPRARERRSLSGTSAPIPIMNDVRSPTSDIASRRPSEVSRSLPLLDEDRLERDREAFRREPPPMVDDSAYAAYATVNSPDEEDEDEEKMEVDR